jgi:hypothetical protein
LAYSVEKLGFANGAKFNKEFRLILCASGSTEEVFSWKLHYLLVSTIRNQRQIANEKSAIQKSEFFNRIGR